MGRNKKAPPPPQYSSPEPIQQLMPNQDIQAYQQQLGQRLLQTPDYSAQRKAFQDNLTQQMNDTYKPMYLNTLNDVNRRLGGLRSSVTSDLMAQNDYNMQKTMSGALNDYIMNEHQQQLNDQNNLLAQYAGINDLYNNAYGMGLNYANAKNGFNQGNYQTQSSSWQFQQQQPNWYQKYIMPNQQAAAQVGAAVAMSDERVKQNIEPIESIHGINFYRFEYKPEFRLSEGKHTGVIAQEVEKIIPDAVTEINGIKHVDYGIVTNYIKEKEKCVH